MPADVDRALYKAGVTGPGSLHPNLRLPHPVRSRPYPRRGDSRARPRRRYLPPRRTQLHIRIPSASGTPRRDVSWAGTAPGQRAPEPGPGALGLSSATRRASAPPGRPSWTGQPWRRQPGVNSLVRRDRRPGDSTTSTGMTTTRCPGAKTLGGRRAQNRLIDSATTDIVSPAWPTPPARTPTSPKDGGQARQSRPPTSTGSSPRPLTRWLQAGHCPLTGTVQAPEGPDPAASPRHGAHRDREHPRRDRPG